MQQGMIFWDWNGTLLDDVEYTRGCLNRLLERFGYRQSYDLATYREIFGFPIEQYYVRAGFDFARHPFPVLAQSFMDDYNADIHHVPPAASAPAVLSALRQDGWQQAVLSASRREDLIEQVSARGLADFFTELLGLRDIYAASKVEVGLAWLRQSDLDPARCVMVGDSIHDAEVAEALGTRCVLYTGGHQSRSRLEAACSHVIDDLSVLPSLLKQL